MDARGRARRRSLGRRFLSVLMPAYHDARKADRDAHHRVTYGDLFEALEPAQRRAPGARSQSSQGVRRGCDGTR